MATQPRGLQAPLPDTTQGGTFFSVADLAHALSVTHQRIYQLLGQRKIEAPASEQGFTPDQFTRIVTLRRRVQRCAQELIAAARPGAAPKRPTPPNEGGHRR